MKKIMIMLLSVCMIVGLAACGNQTTDEGTTSDGDVITDVNENKDENKVEEEAESGLQDTQEETKTLVVYFSNTGNTKAIAESISGGLGAELYEIVAEEPYTDADLDYGDDNSRSTKEMNDASVRPAISGSIENIEQYDTIYIGYPIWWGEAPRILATFVESYDFSDKTIIPFCTSASSGMGSSANGLEELAGSGSWQEGKRFSGSESQEEVVEWAKQF